MHSLRGPNPEKPTQGRKKIIQYLDDLLRNKHFLRDLKKYKKALQSNDFRKYGDLNYFFDKYIKLNSITKKFLKKWKNRPEKIAEKIADKYKLDSQLLNFLIFNENKRQRE